MEIEILQLLDGARKAKGLTVIIDVFRAFSTACYLFDQGIEKIIPVESVSEALEIKNNHPSFILVGEVNEKIPEGFDYGNSPYLIRNVDLSGKTIVHRTSSGTQGLVNAKNADVILTGSFVNAPAIIKYIRNYNPKYVSLVCMGYATIYPTEEDTFCAEFIKFSLQYQLFNLEEAMQEIRNTSAKRLFLPENQIFSPKEDFDLCTDVGKFNFILKLVKDPEFGYSLKKVDS